MRTMRLLKSWNHVERSTPRNTRRGAMALAFREPVTSMRGWWCGEGWRAEGMDKQGTVRQGNVPIGDGAPRKRTHQDGVNVWPHQSKGNVNAPMRVHGCFSWNARKKQRSFEEPRTLEGGIFTCLAWVWVARCSQ